MNLSLSGIDMLIIAEHQNIAMSSSNDPWAVHGYRSAVNRVPTRVVRLQIWPLLYAERGRDSSVGIATDLLDGTRSTTSTQEISHYPTALRPDNE
jgi:hypothetical protein